MLFNSTEIQTVCGYSYAHSIGYIHYQVKIGSSWLQHAGVGERVNQAEIDRTDRFIATL